ncbi:DUF6332 family protein [Streptomyces sp. NPDC087212]|uniref:DUF6332 family protein n=2 Tax=unclassified Streptomyces TaxID=2593676 RepID=UPI003812C800
MNAYGGRRGQARRDAMTVEIGYAVLSAAFAAAVVYGAVAGPALLFALPAPMEHALSWTASALASVLFLARVVSVLVRFQQGPQPSRPRHTRPDSRSRKAS